MQRLSHEELVKNIPDLKGKSEGGYLYHESYVYYSGWMDEGEVFKRAKDDGTEITAFDETKHTSSGGSIEYDRYDYHIPLFVGG